MSPRGSGPGGDSHRSRMAGKTVDVDWSYAPESRIGRLPKPLRPLALVARNAPALWKFTFPDFTYRGDGIATAHESPFIVDEEFSAAYERAAAEWFPGTRVEARWRAWLMTRLARSCRTLPGNLAEFGTYRAGYAFLILSTGGLGPDRRFYLFDTFEGMPVDRLSQQENADGLGGGVFSDTSVEYVEERLSKWSDRVEICPGNVFETLGRTDTGDLAFAHFDLNAAAPTAHALEYAYPRLLPGAIALFDDYGRFNRYDEQKQAIESVIGAEPEEIVALPTGQGFFIKR